MTHDELLALIDRCEDFAAMNGGTSGTGTALRAVVELHEPINSIRGIVCRHCFTDALHSTEFYPCSTIKVILRELI